MSLNNRLVAVAWVLFAGACAGNGCSGCSLEELPAGGLPAAQTVEGGAQIRVTAQGFDTLEEVANDVLGDTLEGGLCMPEAAVDLFVGDLEYCFGDNGGCDDACDVDLHVDSLSLTPATGRIRLRTKFDVHVPVPAQLDTALGTIGPCTLDVVANDNVIDADILLGVRASDGELSLRLGDISELEVHPTISGCGFVGSVIDFIAGVVSDLISDEIVANVVRPMIEQMIDGMLPDPLGVEGMVEVADLFPFETKPDVDAELETRLVPGGYALLEGGGLSLGVITGLNADEDPRSRGGALASEPALCVPPFPAPDLGDVPLPTSVRGTFRMDAAGLFRGMPEPTGDVAFGVSETFLDLVGHHLVSSGALCLGIGTAQIPQLTVSALGLFVPSLAELQSRAGNDPMLLKLRPQRPIGFTIGDGTAGSPALTAHVEDLEIDFYAFLFERYTRAFTMSIDLDVGVDLEFTTDASGAPAVLPILTGLDPKDIAVTVLNEHFVREDKALLESVLPSVLDVALGQLDDGLGAFPLPEFAGFSLDDLATKKVTTSQDDFLAVTATLGAGSMFRALASRHPSIAARLAAAEAAAAAAKTVHAAPTLARVETPAPAVVREALAGRGGALPTVVIEAPATDDRGRALEWTWRVGDGGLWRRFQPGGELRLSDRAFALQGRYAVELRARVVGDYRSLDVASTTIPVVVDSVAPRILADELAADDDTLTVTALDLVSPPAEVEVALGAPGADAPTTPWTGGRFPLAQARWLADDDGELTIFARDGLGNQAVVAVTAPGVLFANAPEAGGCAATGAGGGIGAVLVALGALLGLGRRRRARIAAVLGLVAVGAFGCGSESATCEKSDECAASCAEGQIPLCLEGECVCQAALTVGSIGQHSEMAVDGDGTIWVSAYNRTHGDLMVASTDVAGRIPDSAWTFVDGVPDGPVVVEGTEIRGGVAAPGPDVGEFTDIAVSGGVVLISYFDRDESSLKFASNAGGEWQRHVVDVGRAIQGDDGALVAGQFSSITRGPDGRPGIAYFAMSRSGDQLTTELRFAEATTPGPKGTGDWTIHVVDSAVVTDDGAGEPLPLPEGTGLFANAARLGDGRPVIAYYDREHGDLKLATYDGGEFTTEILDGDDGGDVGWYPGLFVDRDDVVHVTYVNATNDNLYYVATDDREPEVIDDGYRLVGQTEDGLPKPEFHFVGDDSAIVMSEVGPYAAYQDATSHELLVANRGPDDTWRHKTLAGGSEPWVGGYGFYTSGALHDDKLVLSTWVVDQPTSSSWVEILWATPSTIE
jgi:uncharacterized protein (TIGR03382 family)